MKINLLTGVAVFAIAAVLFFGLYRKEELNSPKAVAVEESSAITFEGQTEIKVEEDEMTLRLRKFGLDGGIATFQSDFKNQ